MFNFPVTTPLQVSQCWGCSMVQRLTASYIRKVCWSGQGHVTPSSETCHLPHCVLSEGQATSARHPHGTQVEDAQETGLDNLFFHIPLHFFSDLNALRKQTYSVVWGNRNSDTCEWKCKLVQPFCGVLGRPSNYELDNLDFKMLTSRNAVYK